MTDIKNSSIYAMLCMPRTPMDFAGIVIKNTFGYSFELLKEYNKCRKDELKFPRQVFMTLLVCSGYSLRLAGEPFDKDHATVLWAKNKIINILETKTPINEYQKTIQAINEFRIYHNNINLSQMPGPWHDNDNQELRS